jgi:hypothetical protein
MITAAQKAMQRVLERCGVPCASPSSAKNLNRCCFCLAVDPAEVRANLNRLLDAHGGAGQLNESHANLFSALPVFVPESMIKRMAEAVRALTAVATTEPYQRVALGRAPDIARYDPGSPGGVLGFDFHLTATGPKLIEINTNPGGLLLNAMLAQAQQPCVPELGVAFDGDSLINSLPAAAS